MSNKIPSWEFWDWHSIIDAFFVLAIIPVGIFLIEKGPAVIRHAEEKKLDMTTTARIVSYKENIQPGTYANSSTLYSMGATIGYTYTVNGTNYSKFEVIRNDIPTRRFLSILYHYPNTTLHVKYSSKNPSKSLLVIDSL